MSLDSKTTIRTIDLICEGPIEGIQGRAGVFLNKTPAPDKGVEKADFEQRKGGRNQDRFKGEKTVSVRQVVGEDVGGEYSETLDENGEVQPDDTDYGEGYVIQTVTDLDVDAVELIFTVPRLFSTAVEGLARGQLFPAKIKMEVQIQNSGGSYVTRFTKEIEGISTSSYQFKTPKLDLLKDFLPGTSGPWNIKVKKLAFGKKPKSKDDDDERELAFEIKRSDLVDLPKKSTSLQQGRGDLLQWAEIILHKNIKINYSGTACAALSIDAEEFQSLPSRAYDVKGRKVAIPSNATPHKDGYLQFSDLLPFDGTLASKAQWTTCPVCCFYDMLINKRYGAGEYINISNISWIDLIGISKYCNQLLHKVTGEALAIDQVPENPDDYEPRFAINTVISSQADAYSVVQDLASVFRGMVFWKSDTVQLAADHGTLDGSAIDPIHVFTNSNVVGGSFVYNGSSLKTRSTRVVARYNDPDNFYKPNYIIVENLDAIRKYGLQTREIVAFGCTSKTQAQRMARWVMTSEELEGETVTFSVGLEGLNVLPGQIFAVSDAMRQGVRVAGRVVGADKGKIIADQNVSATTLPGSSDQLTVVLPDGRVQVRAATLNGTSTITVSPNFDEPPADNAVWTITDTSLANQKFRCLSVAEGDDGVYAVIGVQHVDSIYNAVERKDANLEFENTSTFGQAPAEPTDVQIRFFDVTRSGRRFRQINFSWTRGADSRAVKFVLKYKITDSGNLRTISTTNTNVDVSDSVLSGQKVIAKVQAVGPEPNSEKSKFVNVSAFALPDNVTDIIGGGTVENLPPDPEAVTIEPSGKDQVTLRWSPTASGQNIDEFTAVIRHSGKTDGTGVWYRSNLLRTVKAKTTYASLPLMAGEYFVKFENNQGLKSANARSAVINLPDQLPLFNYESMQLNADNFPGINDGVYYDDTFDGLVLDGDASFDDEITDLQAFTGNIDSIFGTQRTTGTFYFAAGFDFGAIYSPIFRRLLDSVGAYRADTFDDRLDLIETWADFDGQVADDVNVEVFVRTAVRQQDDSYGAYKVGDANGDARTDDIVVAEDNTLLQAENLDSLLNDGNFGYGPWVPLENTSYSGRHFQFKAVLSTKKVDQTPVVESLGVEIKFERRTESSDKVIQSGYGPKTVPFDYPFYTDTNTDVAVGITAYVMEPGDFFELSEPTSTGFTVTFKNQNSGAFIDRRFRYTAVGYGTKQA